MSEIPWLLLPEAPSRGLGLGLHAAHARHRRVLTDADFAVIANVLPTVPPHTWPCPPATNIPFLPTFQGAVTLREPCHGWAGTLRSSAQSLGLHAGMRAHLSKPEGNRVNLMATPTLKVQLWQAPCQLQVAFGRASHFPAKCHHMRSKPYEWLDGDLVCNASCPQEALLGEPCPTAGTPGSAAPSQGPQGSHSILLGLCFPT